MRKRSDDIRNDDDWDAQRERIIGLGDRSFRKTYYPVLRNSLASLNSLLLAVDQIASGIAICNLSGSVEFVNPALCHITGFAQSELIGHTLHQLWPSSREALDALKLVCSGQTWRQDLALRHKDGREYWTQVTLTPVHDDTRTITHCAAVLEDISIRKGIEAELQRRVEERTAELVAKNELLEKEIEERTRAERELLLLHRAVNASTDALFIQDLTDMRGPIIDVNEAACRSLGYSRNELLGKTPMDIDPDITQEKLNEIGLAVIPGQTFSFETRHRAKDGRIFPVDLVSTIFEDENGRYSISTARDITERKRMIDRLQQSEREFRSLAENTPDNVARWDTAGRILYSNPTHQRTLGKPTVEMIGKTHGELFPDDRYSQIDEAIAHIAASGEEMLVRAREYRKNNETRMHEVKLVPERDEDGAVVSVLGLGRDMTEIYSLQEAIAAREQEFRTVVENLPDFVIRYDRDCRRSYISPSYERNMGFPIDTALGKTPGEFWPIQEDPAGGAAFETHLRRILDSGHPEEWDINWTARDGSQMFQNIRAVPEFDGDGRTLDVLVIFRDMTATRKLMQQLEAQHEAMKLAMEEIKTLKGILPICSYCKKIRDDSGYWNQLEVYIRDHSDANFSHGICPDCMTVQLAELKKLKNEAPLPGLTATDR